MRLFQREQLLQTQASLVQEQVMDGKALFPKRLEQGFISKTQQPLPRGALRYLPQDGACLCADRGIFLQHAQPAKSLLLFLREHLQA